MFKQLIDSKELTAICTDDNEIDYTKLRKLGEGAYGAAYELSQNTVVKVFVKPYEGLQEVINI